jgi:hypothetical protein
MMTEDSATVRPRFPSSSTGNFASGQTASKAARAAASPRSTKTGSNLVAF